MKSIQLFSAKTGLISLIIILSFSSLKAQSYSDLKTQDGVTIKYKWKENKEGKTELRVKFKNQTKAHVKVDTEIAFYIKGVLEETAELNDCLKKSFFDNLFRPIQIVNSSLSNEQLQSSDLKLEATEFKVEKTDECRETDS